MPPGFQQRSIDPQSALKSNLELILENFIQDQTKSMKEVKESLKEHKETFQQHDTKFVQIFTHLKLLDNQVASQASSSNFRQPGHFPSQPQNPREQAQAITLRSGKNLPEAEVKNKEQKAELKKVLKKQTEAQQQKEVKTPCLPFPQRMHNSKLDKQLQKVFNVFKQLDITIPFLEAVT